MNTLRVFLIVTILAIAAAHARLGETPAECAARYGPATLIPASGQPGVQVGYTFKGFTIVVTFINKHAESMTVTKPGGEISEEEFLALAGANSASGEWSQMGRGRLIVLTRADGAKAMLREGSATLFTPAVEKAREAERNAGATSIREGF